MTFWCQLQAFNTMTKLALAFAQKIQDLTFNSNFSGQGWHILLVQPCES